MEHYCSQWHRAFKHHIMAEEIQVELGLNSYLIVNYSCLSNAMLPAVDVMFESNLNL